MPERDPDRLKRYLELISRPAGGLDQLVEHVARTQPLGAAASAGLESIDGTSENDKAQAAVEMVARGMSPGQDEAVGLEAIIYADLRPAIDIVGGRFTVTHPLWRKLSDDATLRTRIERAIPRVGRIELPGYRNAPYGGTGFVVGDGLIMTNRHVAAIFAAGLGDHRLAFITGRSAGIDFLREKGGAAGTMLAVRGVKLIHPYWDLAILSVEGLPEACKPLKLSVRDARDLSGSEIFVVGYPAYDPRNAADDQFKLFGTAYGIKRLQPGILHDGAPAASFGKTVKAATHDCSTLGGNSGSAVCALDADDEVLALHFGGSYQEANYAVPTAAMARDSRIVDAGVVFSDKAPGDPNDWGAWWARADSGMETTADIPRRPPEPRASVVTSAPPPPRPEPARTISVEIPLRVTITVGEARAITAEAGPAAVAEAVAEAGTEALVEPAHDADYTDRSGYASTFLADAGTPAGALDVPMPTLADRTAAATTRDGGTVLPYQNFSLVMHRLRRIAAVTAVNVSREASLRRPEAGRDYSRKGLTDLGRNDQERWFLDPRLDEACQLPDVFFTRDDGAFDKGHIVRREDAAWGTSYDAVRRANGDTFHVTNCSPQVAAFNRSNLGEQNWGDLENLVFAQAASERLCVLAGPVLAPADGIFLGRGGGGKPLRVRIPSRFWKVIVARVDEGLAAFGFVLEQDLSALPEQEEFTVSGEFMPFLTRIADIATLTGLIFAPALTDADQYDRARGDEMVAQGQVPRRRAA